MNYSYPPLLYQRGDDSEDEEEGMDEEEEDSQGSHNQFALDDDDIFNMENLMGHDLDELDNNNADLKQHEQVIDGLFEGDQGENDQSPDGIENVDISDIQKMINKSSESPVLEAEQEMFNELDFNLRKKGEGIEFYKQQNEGAVGAVIDQMANDEMEYYNEYYDEELGEGLEDMEAEEMMKMMAGHNEMEEDFSNLLAGGDDD